MTILSCGVMSFMGLPKIGYGRAGNVIKTRIIAFHNLTDVRIGYVFAI